MPNIYVSQIPTLDTASRNSITNPKLGFFIYNTDSLVNQVYDGSNWIDVGSDIATLQSAYDNGPTIQMQAGVDIEFKTSGNVTVLSLSESSNFAQVQNLLASERVISAQNVLTNPAQVSPFPLQDFVENTGPASNSQVIYEKQIIGKNSLNNPVP